MLIRSSLHELIAFHDNILIEVVLLCNGHVLY